MEDIKSPLGEQLAAVKLEISAGKAEICGKIDKIDARIEEVNPQAGNRYQP